MRRHTVEIAQPQNETAALPTAPAHYFTQHHHHHYQPTAAGQFLHPTMFAPGVAAGHGLPHVYMPQDLSVHSASEDESSPTSYLSSAVADSHLLRPPQIAGMIVMMMMMMMMMMLIITRKCGSCDCIATLSCPSHASPLAL